MSLRRLLSFAIFVWLCPSLFGLGMAQEREPATPPVTVLRVAERSLSHRPATAWGMPGTLVLRRLVWTDQTTEEVPVLWHSEPPFLEIAFAADFNARAAELPLSRLVAAQAPLAPLASVELSVAPRTATNDVDSADNSCGHERFMGVVTLASGFPQRRQSTSWEPAQESVCIALRAQSPPPPETHQSQP